MRATPVSALFFQSLLHCSALLKRERLYVVSITASQYFGGCQTFATPDWRSNSDLMNQPCLRLQWPMRKSLLGQMVPPQSQVAVVVTHDRWLDGAIGFDPTLPLVCMN